jgi:hypothetical protein
MTVILGWLSRQVIWISLICLIGSLGYLVTAGLAKRKRDRAQFTLEREVYHQQVTRARLVAALFLALAAMVLGVSLHWLPAQPEAESATATPSSGLYTLTPAATQSNAPLSATSTVTQVVVSAPEILATITPTPLSTRVPPEQLQPDCPDPGASAIVEVLGTAQVNAFSYYRFEVIFPGSETPNFIAQYDAMVENGALGLWDVSDVTRYPLGGPYRFQLVVVDIYGNTTTCIIPVDIVSQAE